MYVSKDQAKSPGDQAMAISYHKAAEFQLKN